MVATVSNATAFGSLSGVWISILVTCCVSAMPVAAPTGLWSMVMVISGNSDGAVDLSLVVYFALG